MKYDWKVFIWEDGRKGAEYTQHLLAPVYLEDRLDETLDSGEIVLEHMEQAEPFAPKTKFRIERSQEDSSAQKTWDMVVDHDDVEHYAGLPGKYCHRVYLIEPSVIAQGMHVDNIALTYELQDVTLNYKTTATNQDTIVLAGATVVGNEIPTRVSDTISESANHNKDVSFINSYRYVWQDTESIGKVKQVQDANSPVEIAFNIPHLYCQGCNPGNEFEKLFEMNVTTIIYREELKLSKPSEDGLCSYEVVPNTKKVVETYESGPKEITNIDSATHYAYAGIAYLRTVKESQNAGSMTKWEDAYDKALSISYVKTRNQRTVTYTAPALTNQEIESGKSYRYYIECTVDAIPEAMLTYYHAKFQQIPHESHVGIYNSIISVYESEHIRDNASLTISTCVEHRDMSITNYGGMIITRGTKYNCYSLLRKALLTCDTYIIDNNTQCLDEYDFNKNPCESISYPIIVESKWKNRLKMTTMRETTLETKNLWEVLLQIGYYIHAIPYLEFARDGTDRFVLKFRQLGETQEKPDESNKITVFSSRALSEFYTQYDSYVTNLYSPQNLCEEWVVPKTSDSSYLVSNDTAELQLSYGISEIVEFDIAISKSDKTKPALKHIFEKSIYDILANTNPYKVSLCKGAALYYTLGDNKIQGLSFVPPSVNAGEFPNALKRIIEILWQGEGVDIKSMSFNDLSFHIKYRTQDAARVTQFRPDLQNFMKNSSYDKYPHHEQFYGQQDKIIDSERFTANLFGRLIRVGNAVYQRQECASAGSERESGDLVEINHEPYYVTDVENEYYPDIILQKVTYSKDFNQLSNIVTIPSEPRFYEVSERSKIRREVRMQEFLKLSTKEPTAMKAPRFLHDENWIGFIKKAVFGETGTELPNYAWTKFKADKKRARSNNIECESLFPSSVLNRLNENSLRPESASDHSECIVPLLHFPLHDGIVFEWDMADNFKAGDFIDAHIDYDAENTPKEDAYLSQQPLRYVDVFGRADLFTFKLFHKDNWTFEERQKLPQATCRTWTDTKCLALVKCGDNEDTGIALDKDCREAISFNFQVNLLHEATESDKEDFIIYPNLFGEKTGALKVCLLDAPQSMFNENLNLAAYEAAKVIADNVPYKLTAADNALKVEFSLDKLHEDELDNVKSIVFYDGEANSGDAYIVKNVSSLDKTKKLQSWWMYPVYAD